MTGAELKAAREAISAALGQELSPADMAKVLGLPPWRSQGAAVVIEWEEGDGPPGPVAVLVKLLQAGITPDPDPGRIDFIIGSWFNSYIRDLLDPSHIRNQLGR